METKSLKGLTQVVERTENLANRIRDLNSVPSYIQIPDMPLPLSLRAMEAWLELVAECSRKPLLARSKRSLEAKGVATARIPGDVLEKVEPITELLGKIDALHVGLRAAALEFLGRALTKGIEDAETIISAFAAASDELDTLVGSAEWIVSLVAEKCAEKPEDAKAIVEAAKQVVEHCNAAAKRGIVIEPFESLDKASMILTALNASIQEDDRVLALEGLSGDRVSLIGLSVVDASNVLDEAKGRISREKEQLTSELNMVRSQLELTGIKNDDSASSLADLRQLVPRLQKQLNERRHNLQSSLGPVVFEVVQSLTKGDLPATERVSDGQLGKSIRKAVVCGYRFLLEAPREN